MSAVFLKRYATACAAYGSCHAVVHLWDAQGVYNNNKAKPLLLADKLAYATVLTLLSPAYWPAMLHYDLRRFEIVGRRNGTDYSYDEDEDVHFLLGPNV